MTLLEECQAALGNYRILPEAEAQEVQQLFEKDFDISSWGRINWDSSVRRHSVSSNSEILQLIVNEGFKKDDSVVILWDNAALPVIESSLKSVISAFDDVVAVSFDTWLYSRKHKYVIENYHEGEITIGMAK